MLYSMLLPYTTVISMAKSMQIFLLFVLTILAANISAANYNEEGWHWTWLCDIKSERCERKSQPTSWATNPQPFEPLQYNSLSVCRLTCGRFGALWPKPTITTVLAHQLVAFHPNLIRFQILNAVNEAKDFLVENTRLFHDNLVTECGANCSSFPSTEVTIFLSVDSSDLTLNWQTNETYSLDVATKGSKVIVQIQAENVFGVRHGLESLTQLTASYPLYPKGLQGSLRELVMVAGARIRDKPVYRHRGLLLDTARNYLPISAIKRQIDAMAASKLNILHWHATDSQSFPLESTRVPQMTRYGAYSAKQVYRPTDIRHLLKYAKLRGIRIILEIDAPSHSGNGWQWGREAGLGDLAVCVNQDPWRSYCIQPPCGQLNPVNPHLYNVLGDLYHDFIDIFPRGEAFHMGGDEVFLPCWNSTPEIINYLERNGRGRATEDFLQLWGEYQAEALNVYDAEVGNRNTPMIVWSSALTDPDIIYKYLSKYRYIIETWVPSSDDLPLRLLNMGYKLIISTKDAWYLDHGFWGTTQYHTWRTGYSNRLPRHDGVLGGEVCMWGELVDEHTVDNRIWPRAAAAAERLWSDPDSGTASAESRFYRHRERLIARGVHAEALAPRWCYQNEGECV